MYKHDPLTYLLEQIGSIERENIFVIKFLYRDASKWNEFYTIKIKRQE